MNFTAVFRSSASGLEDQKCHSTLAAWLHAVWDFSSKSPSLPMLQFSRLLSLDYGITIMRKLGSIRLLLWSNLILLLPFSAAQNGEHASG